MSDKNVADLERELLALFDQQRQAGVNPVCVLSASVLKQTYGIGATEMVAAQDDLSRGHGIRAVAADNGDVTFMPAATTAS